MKYQTKESEERSGAYLVVAINEGNRDEICSVLFSGPEAKRRAEEYADWKNSQLEVTGEQLLRR
jgi:hypothetical protein